MPGVPTRLAVAGLGPNVEGEPSPYCTAPVEARIAGLIARFCEPVSMAVEGGWGCGVAGESNDPPTRPGACCDPTRSL